MTGPAPIPATGPGTPDTANSSPDSTWVDTAVGQRRRRRQQPPAERVRRLLWLGLLGAAVLALWLRWLAAAPHLPLELHATPNGQVVLAASTEPALRPAVGHTLQALVLADGHRLAASSAWLHASPRWVADDDARQALMAQRTGLDQAMRHGRVIAEFDGGLQASLAPRPRGLSGLGAQAWLLSALALALYLAAAVTLLAQPGPAAVVYLALAVAQALGLLLQATSGLPGLGAPAGLAGSDLGWRLAADLATAAALLHLLLLYPRRHPWATVAAGLAWATALVALAVLLLATPPLLWWWAQGLLLAAGLAAAWMLRRRGGPPWHPLGRLLQRLALVGTAALLLLSLAVGLGANQGLDPALLATLGPLAWAVFLTALLMLGPLLTRSRQLLRELALLTGVSTVAALLTLLLLALIGLQAMAAPGLALVVALAVSMVVSLAVYLSARRWVLHRLAGPGQRDAERMFDSVYRAARALEQSPGLAAQQLGALLRDVFDPREVARSQRTASRVRVAADGSTLVVPVPGIDGPPHGTLVLRYAQQGRRLFTPADGQLCERLLDQLSRAVAYDRAVERGRVEERVRIAQDLHDDIGARLLTLMYKAPNDEIEDYIRHTLQDLKTLTRGLAASNQRLSHAAAEWKADISQRLSAAGCSLHWSFSADRDITLTAVQWSGLTRVLRELVSNIITHARASQVEISVHLDRGRLALVVTDDGIGRAPAHWAHGLGLGGVRKRVKLLGGQVSWQDHAPQGIRCEMTAQLAVGPDTRRSHGPG